MHFINKNFPDLSQICVFYTQCSRNHATSRSRTKSLEVIVTLLIIKITTTRDIFEFYNLSSNLLIIF